MKKILIFTMAFLSVFARCSKLQAAAAAQPEGKRSADDQSDDGKRLCEGFPSMTLEQKNEALFDAIASNNLQRAQDVIAAGASIEGLNSFGQTPLYRAVVEDSPLLVKIFLAHGADVNFKDKFQITPLHMAVKRQSIEVVGMLLAAGAVVDAEDDKQKTPLHRAMMDRNSEIVKILVDKGASVERPDIEKLFCYLNDPKRDKPIKDILIQKTQANKSNSNK